MIPALTPTAAPFVAVTLLAVVALAAWAVRWVDGRVCRFANDTHGEDD